MSKRTLAAQDFERAVLKAAWRKIYTWLRGESNELLPFDAVREKLPIRNQHYVGMRQVPVSQIVGSQGRFHDFDRMFLPLHTKTKDRWISIDAAFHEDVVLPPVELYKMGEIYFVKDGNHRVSVARERGQEFVDAYVIEIEVPVRMTVDTRMDDLEVKKEYAAFLEQTRLGETRGDVQMETRLIGQYDRILEHIAVHRWYLGEQKGAEAPFEEAALSWYDQVFTPFREMLRAQNLLNEFPAYSEVDLYLWIMQYHATLRQAYKEGPDREEPAGGQIDPAVKTEIGKQVAGEYPHLQLRKLFNALNRAGWVDELMLEQERAGFLRRTNIQKLHPEAHIETKVPGQYDKLLEHIAVHHWYLGEQRGSLVPYAEGVTSWYNNVYLPLVKIMREQGIMENFPGSTETDLYLWILARKWILEQMEK